MRSYIGTKIIKAEPMTDMDFEKERSLYNEAKHLVKMYRDGHSLFNSGSDCCASEPRQPKNGYKVMYADDYISWSPKVTFEEAYRLVSEAEKKLV